MTKKFILRLSLLLVVVALIGLSFIPLLNDTKYGLDLKGGFEVLYKINPIDSDKLTDDMVTATYRTLTKRIDNLGVSEPEITIEGGNRIRIKLAGVTEDTAREMLGRTATLTFRDTSNNLLMTSEVLKPNGAGYAFEGGKYVVTLGIADIDKFYEVTSTVSQMSDNRIVIWLDFEEGIDSFAKEEKSCGTDKSKCLSVASVPQAFASDVQIEGSFTKEEVMSLSSMIKSGALPTKLTELSSKTVNASFGIDTLNKTFKAGLLGIALVFIIMSLLYRFAGFVASIGLVMYTFLVFSVFWTFGGVLTLPGIASLLLGIGMAVDANILSFERIKEELWAGRNLKDAFKTGYQHSFSSIIDSNLTTLLVAIVLFIFGESSVKGFATMLIISIFATIFVMVLLVKWLLKLFVETNFFNNKVTAFVNVRKKDLPNEKQKENTHKISRFTKIDYLKYRKWFFALSLLIFIVGTIFTFVYGLNLSVDFKGGTDFTITLNETASEKTIKDDFKELGYDEIEISTINNKTVYIKMSDTLDKDKIKTITNHFQTKYDAGVQNGAISTIVKQELVKNAVISLTLAIIGIIIYISFRFTFAFAISSIIALLHDVFFVIAMFSIFRFEINTIFIAAILTIIGYSINDTVVIFDRIREEKKLHPKDDAYKTTNRSLGLTMTRSLYTGINAMITVVCLLLFGSPEIFDFNVAMLLGMGIGCYSSICIASSLWYEMIKNKTDAGFEKKKKVYKDKYEELTVKGINS